MKRKDFIMMFLGCVFINRDKIFIEDSPNKLFKGGLFELNGNEYKVRPYRSVKHQYKYEYPVTE